MTTALSMNAWGIIQVKGEEAVAFLQSQFTQSVTDLGKFAVRQAGFCTAKGRLLGTFFMLKPEEDTVWLFTRRDLIAPLCKRLNMFKLRMKCTIEDISPQYKFAYSGQMKGSSGDTWAREGDSLLLLFGEGEDEFAVVVTPAENEATILEAEGDRAFQAGLIALGKAFVSAPVVERFTPQEINMDLTGGVSFQKGCYPGQEVVARSHYLGKVKRRAFIAKLKDMPAQAGEDVWLLGKENEPAGSVVATGVLKGIGYALLDLPVQDALASNSLFSFESAQSTETFTVNPPPYDVMSKGQ